MDPEILAALLGNSGQSQAAGMAGQGLAQAAAPGMSDVDFLLQRLSQGAPQMTAQVDPQAGGGVPMLPPQASQPEQAPVDPGLAPLWQSADQRRLADQQLATQRGTDAQAYAMLAGQLPAFGGQIGQLIDTLSDRRAKTDIEEIDDDVEYLLSRLG